MDIYSCVNCGYSESYIADEKERSYIADHWTPVPAGEPDTPPAARLMDETAPGRPERTPIGAMHDTQRLPPLAGGR